MVPNGFINVKKDVKDTSPNVNISFITTTSIASTTRTAASEFYNLRTANIMTQFLYFQFNFINTFLLANLAFHHIFKQLIGTNEMPLSHYKSSSIAPSPIPTKS